LKDVRQSGTYVQHAIFFILGRALLHFTYSSGMTFIFKASL